MTITLTRKDRDNYNNNNDNNNNNHDINTDNDDNNNSYNNNKKIKIKYFLPKCTLPYFFIFLNPSPKLLLFSSKQLYYQNLAALLFFLISNLILENFNTIRSFYF